MASQYMIKKGAFFWTMRNKTASFHLVKINSLIINNIVLFLRDFLAYS